MKKSVSILFSVLLMLSFLLPGCSNAPSTGVTGAAKTDAIGSLPPASGWSSDTSPVTMSAYIDYDWYALDTWGKDDVSKEITKRTGVSLDVTKSSDRNQLSVLLASGELSDIVFTDNLTQRFEDPSVCFPWDELMTKYAPEFLTSIDPIELKNNTALDGHFYTLKTHYNNAEAWADKRNLPSPGTSGFYIREDIMQKIGNPKLDSIEDLLPIFATVKEKQSELGIDIIYNPHPTWNNPLGEFMGIYSTYVDESTDTVKTVWSNPRQLDYFKFINTLYRDGYLYKEAYSSRPEDFFQRNRTGKVFSASYNAGLAGETNKIFDEQGISGKFIPVCKALTWKGQTLLAPVDSGIGWSSCFISKNCKTPERAIRYMQFLKSPEGDALTQWGIEGKHYTLDSEGLLIRPEGFTDKLVTETGIGPWYFQASGLGEGVAVMSGKTLKDEKARGYAMANIDLLVFKKPFFVRNPILYFARLDPASDEFVMSNKLLDEWNKQTQQIIMADSEAKCVELFNNLMTYMKDNGLEQVEKAMTDNYNKAKARYN